MFLNYSMCVVGL